MKIAFPRIYLLLGAIGVIIFDVILACFAYPCEPQEGCPYPLCLENLFMQPPLLALFVIFFALLYVWYEY
jgi:hypothetical protein